MMAHKPLSDEQRLRNLEKQMARVIQVLDLLQQQISNLGERMTIRETLERNVLPA